MTPDQPRVNAPEFPAGLEWLNSDQPLTLRALRGKIVLLEFWTFCCINCQHNIPHLRRLRELFPNELVVIGVHSAKFPSEQLTSNIHEAVQRHEIDYPVVNDAGFRIWDEYAVRAWPTIVLIDDRGKVVRTQSGEFLAEEVAPAIRSLVALAATRGTLDQHELDRALPLRDEPLRPLRYPSKLLLGPEKQLFVADTGHHRVVELLLSDDGRSAEVARVFGSGVAALRDGAASAAAFHSPHGMDIVGDTLYVADTDNHAVRAIDLGSGVVRTVAGTGAKAHGRLVIAEPTATPLRSPWDVLQTDRDTLLIAMAGSHQIWALHNEQQVYPWAGAGFEGLVDGSRSEAGFNQPSDLDDGAGHLLIADAEASAIRAIPLNADGEVMTLVGQGLFVFGDVDGIAEDVRLQHPTGLAYGGGLIFIADTYNNKIKVLDPTTSEVTTLIGTGDPGYDDGPFFDATLYAPEGLALDKRDDTLLMYIADTNNHLIRIADLATGELHTLRLRGIDQLATARPIAPKVAHLDGVTVGAGTIAFTFDVVLPVGYKINSDAPLTLQDAATGAVYTFAADEPIMVEIDITRHEERSFNLTVYYCATENEALCRIHDIALLVPIELALDGPHDATLRYVVQR